MILVLYLEKAKIFSKSIPMKSTMKQYKSLELSAHVELDDVMHKVAQEVGELHEAYLLKDPQEIQGEVRDSIINILSVCDELRIELGTVEKGNEISPEKLLAHLSNWNQKVQSLRSRYMRQSATKEEVAGATSLLISSVLAYAEQDMTFDEIIAYNTQKFSSRVERYLPKIDLRDYVKAYPDFPKKGILFQDVSPMLANPEAMRYVTYELAKRCENADVIVGLDARGFLFGMMVSALLGKPFVMIRKKGKLPGEKEAISYGLEYGKDTIEIQKDAIAP